jgi:head-tail adaptor
MRTGKLFDIIVIKTMTTTTTSGDRVETWDSGVTARASVKQIDGTRYLAGQELIDRRVYEILLWGNNWGNNIKIEYEGLTLWPIRPVQENDDRSMRDVVKIIAATKV